MDSRKSTTNPPGISRKTAREQRLAAELRANLKRRKAAVRSHASDATTPMDGEGDTSQNGADEPNNGA